MTRQADVFTRWRFRSSPWTVLGLSGLGRPRPQLGAGSALRRGHACGLGVGSASGEATPTGGLDRGPPDALAGSLRLKPGTLQECEGTLFHRKENHPEAC